MAVMCLLELMNTLTCPISCLNLCGDIAQKEVALLLAQGCSNEIICQRLHIKLTTTKSHIRKIFAKMGIHGREELLPLLLALNKS